MDLAQLPETHEDGGVENCRSPICGVNLGLNSTIGLVGGRGAGAGAGPGAGAFLERGSVGSSSERGHGLRESRLRPVSVSGPLGSVALVEREPLPEA